MTEICGAIFAGLAVVWLIVVVAGSREFDWRALVVGCLFAAMAAVLLWRVF